MLLPPLILPLLNATANLTSAEVGCYGPSLPGDAPIKIITYKECKAAIVKIPMGQKALAPLIFGRSAGAGFQTPYQWVHGDCEIAIDVLSDEIQERSTFAAIFKRAFDLMVECVIKPPHYGGVSLIGENDDLEVTVRQG